MFFEKLLLHLNEILLETEFWQFLQSRRGTISGNFVTYETVKNEQMNKSGVINDPLSQPTVPAGSDFHSITRFWNGRTDRQCENNDHYRPGLWSALWINNREA